MLLQRPDMVITGIQVSFAGLSGNIAHIYLHRAAGLDRTEQVLHQQVGQEACV